MGVPVDLSIAWIEGQIEASFTVGVYPDVHCKELVKVASDVSQH